MDEGLISQANFNDDFSRPVVLRTAAMDWQASPSASVWRKRLERIGDDPEKAQVTSVVRYDSGSAFAAHDHPDGEEIFVLDGIFSDQHGDYPAGTFLLNPTGFRHAPFSNEGCTLFVKLRQYGGPRAQVTVDTATAAWEPRSAGGIAALPLHRGPDGTEFIRLLRFAPGAELPTLDQAAEFFILDGALADRSDVFETGDWMRYPPGSYRPLRSKSGATVYLKTGHFPR